MKPLLIEVRLFAALREATASSTVALELPANATVGDLRQLLVRRWPQWRTLLERCAVAVNQAYAPDQQRLTAGDEVALIPPVSGG
ncbi:MAG: molybdopterin converting factor subunit 1 [Gemmataceae bacterium]|nr:molybdopterin converting factor subunit 1 [Gemmataceae bacterium]